MKKEATKVLVVVEYLRKYQGLDVLVRTRFLHTKYAK